LRNKTLWLFCCAALISGCAGVPKGDRAEDYLPFTVPWTGVFKSGDKDPQLLVVKHAAPRGKVWSIEVSKFYLGGQFAFFITNEERGILLHTVVQGNGVAKLDAPQLLIPRTLSEGTGWSASSVARGNGELDVKITGGPDLQTITVAGRPVRARFVRLDLKGKADTTTLTFWLSPGTGIVRFQGGAADLLGDWDLAEVREEKK
jgi:hypothetical protein